MDAIRKHSPFRFKQPVSTSAQPDIVWSDGTLGVFRFAMQCASTLA
jgi:hypothetical protein